MSEQDQPPPRPESVTPITPAQVAETVEALHKRLQREKRTYAPSEMLGRAQKLERELARLRPLAAEVERLRIEQSAIAKALAWQDPYQASLVKRAETLIAKAEALDSKNAEVERLKGAVGEILRATQGCDESWDLLVRVDNIATAALAATPPAPSAMGGWRPIEEAPRDGTKILGLLKNSDYPHVVHFKVRYGWRISWDDYDLSEFDGPTHWQPLPPPPAQ